MNQEICRLTGHPGVRLKTSTDDEVKPHAVQLASLQTLNTTRACREKALMWCQCSQQRVCEQVDKSISEQFLKVHEDGENPRACQETTEL